MDPNSDDPFQPAAEAGDPFALPTPPVPEGRSRPPWGCMLGCLGFAGLVFWIALALRAFRP